MVLGFSEVGEYWQLRAYLKKNNTQQRQCCGLRKRFILMKRKKRHRIKV